VSKSAYEDIKLLSVLLLRIETQPFDSPRLLALKEKLSSHSLPASATLSKLATIVGFVEARRNPLLAPLMLPLMYVIQSALVAERGANGTEQVVESWLNVLGEIEALVSLASYSFERPEDPFPEFLGRACRIRCNGTRPSVDCSASARSQRRRSLRPDEGAPRKRLEHVGQEHLLRSGRHQYGPGNGGAPVCARTSGSRRFKSEPASASMTRYTRQFAFLCRNHPAAATVRAIASAAAVSLGRVAARDHSNDRRIGAQVCCVH